MFQSITVALAVFDGERYIAEQLGSILGQTRAPDEIIVADDGSTDRTLDIVREVFESRTFGSPVLRILTADGARGVTRNFERAVRAATGDLIVLSDQDDVWHPDRLARAVESFERDPSLLLQHADARLVDAQGTSLGASLFEALYVSSDDKVAIANGRAFDTYMRRNLVTGATVVLRRELLEWALPFPDEWVHDEWLAIIAAAMGRVELFDEPLIDYRQHGANAIGVTVPTLRSRIGRMLQPRGDRYRELSARSARLVERLEAVGAPREALVRAREKARFEGIRAGLSNWRLARIRTVLGERRRGSYRLLSSQGNLDVLRDILQPR